MKDYLRPYRGMIAAIVILAIAQAILQIWIIVSIKPVLRDGINTLDLDTILNKGFLLIVLVLAYSLIAVSVGRLSTAIGAKTARDIRRGLFDRIVDMNEPNESGVNLPGLMTRLTSDVDSIQTAIIDSLRIGIYIPVLMVSTIVFISTLQLAVGIMMAVSTVLILGIIALISRKEVAVRDGIQQTFDRVIRHFRNFVTGIKTMRAFRRQDSEYASFSVDNRQLGRSLTAVSIRLSYLTPAVTLVIGLGIIAVISIVLTDDSSVRLYLPDTVLFLQFVVLFVSCASLVPFLFATIPSAKASYLRIKEVMEAPVHGGTEKASDDDVIVKCVSDGFEIRRGEDVSIVGKIGAGKSTLINTVMRFKCPEEGELFFEGKDISRLDPSYVRSRIAYAGDRAMTFRGTLFENIDVWRGNTPERIEECCRLALMYDVDLSKTIWDTSKGLSSGERMKISIARALASDADLYIFDDCFNEMDAKTESEIVANIRSALKGRTVIFVSENVRIASGSDKIGFFENGRIIGHGTHSEMMDSCIPYRDMKNAAEVFL